MWLASQLLLDPVGAEKGVILEGGGSCEGGGTLDGRSFCRLCLQVSPGKCLMTDMCTAWWHCLQGLESERTAEAVRAHGFLDTLQPKPPCCRRMALLPPCISAAPSLPYQLVTMLQALSVDNLTPASRVGVAGPAPLATRNLLQPFFTPKQVSSPPSR